MDREWEHSLCSRDRVVHPDGMDISQEQFNRMLLILPVLLLSVAIHEFAHCWTTDRLGDDTPRRQGRVTLNPLVHLDPIGTLFMVVTAFAGFGIGWGRSSPFNPYNFRHPARDRMLTALAGPASNLLQMLAWASIGLLIVTLLPYGAITTTLATMAYFGVTVNVTLAIFNLIPVYPLDGHHVMGYLIPPLQPLLDNPNGMYVLLLLLLIPGPLQAILYPAIEVAEATCALLIGWPSL